MDAATFTCPRCLYSAGASANVRFCPHCGLPDAATSAADTSPLDVTIAG